MMAKRMLLDEKELHFTKQNLPLLIHGDDGYGASLFSVSVIADLYSQGANLIFLCGYHMARDEFESQTQSHEEAVVFDSDSSLDLANKRVVFIPSEHPELLGHALHSLSDSDERVVFLKNFDLFDETIFSLVDNCPNLVMMGDIDRCSYASKLLEKQWASRLYFSIPKTEMIEIPKLEQYKGYLRSNNREGIVSLMH